MATKISFPTDYAMQSFFDQKNDGQNDTKLTYSLNPEKANRDKISNKISTKIL